MRDGRTWVTVASATQGRAVTRADTAAPETAVSRMPGARAAAACTCWVEAWWLPVTCTVSSLSHEEFQTANAAPPRARAAPAAMRIRRGFTALVDLRRHAGGPAARTSRSGAPRA